MTLKLFVLLAGFSVFLAGCAGMEEMTPAPEVEEAPLSITPSRFSDLPGWEQENFYGLGQAYGRSCGRVLKKDPQALFGIGQTFGKAEKWQHACRKYAEINPDNAAELRAFFEQNFIPYTAMAGTKTEGLFTGYYEAALKGSKTRKGPYQYPLRVRPDDLVMVDLGEFREELKGQRIAGRVKEGKLKPYETHADIIAGKLPKDQDKTLVWVDSPIDAFFIQIQGSGTVSLEDGTMMRVGYAGQNGHPYYAVGRELVARGEMDKDSVSMQSIRQWMLDHPEQAQELMLTNKSYVFFRALEGSGPEGGEGVALTPERSLAIDHSIIPYGMPVWLSADHPDPQKGDLQRLMITQDTGGAIRGPVRGDFFWGYGSSAEAMAGAMKSKGRYWFLLPEQD